MIIVGITTRQKQIGRGQFFCPQCRSTRHYKHKAATRYFTLFFIPLIPLGESGKFVECESCGMTFKPAVLEKGQLLQAVVERSQSDLAKLINALPDKLQAGIPVEYLCRDLTAAGLDRDRALEMVNSHLKQGRKTCEACGLTYASTIFVCGECGQPL